MRSCCGRRTVFVVLALAFLGAAGVSAERADFRLFFSRSFRGSMPEYFEVTIDGAGHALYREDAEEEPMEFQVTPTDLATVLTHVEKLDYFRVSPAHSRRVAHTGDKTFRYTDPGGDTSETTFDYTENPDAQALVTWFLKVGETERHRIELERMARFDRLGVNKRLLSFQISLEKGRIVSPKQMLPILRRIANDKKIIQLSRSRAAALVERIENGATD